MSTFVFAPSWVNYPNHSKTTLKEEEIDEFPTLLSHNKNNNNNSKKENNNNNNNSSVWSNPSLIQKIHQSGEDEDEEDIDYYEKRYELERLKALVPKTKKSISTIHGRKPKNSSRHSYHQTPTLQPSPTTKNNAIKKSSPITTTTTININNNITTPPPTPKEHHTTTTSTKIIPITTTTLDIQKNKEPITQKHYISKQEQQHFIYFIKSWTSTRVISNNNNNHRDYSHFNYSIDVNSNHSSSCYSSDTSDSSFHSDIDMNHSFFQYDPFPIRYQP